MPPSRRWGGQAARRGAGITRELRALIGDNQSVSRERLLATKAAHVCHYCRVDLTPETLTVDHIVPRSLGGRDLSVNLATCCVDGNQAKATRRWHRDCKRCNKAWRRWQRDEAKRLAA